MGVAFSGAFFGANVQHNYADLTNDTMQQLDQKCNTGNTVSADVSNFQLNLENVNCGNIQLVTQTVSADESCTINTTAQAIQNNVAQQIAGAESNSGGSGGIALFGVNIQSNEVKSTNKVEQQIKAVCGDANTAASQFQDVVVNGKNIKCNNLNILTQKSSIQSQCAMAGYAEAVQSNKVLQSAGSFSTSDIFILIGICIGVLALLILIIYCIHHFAHRRTIVQPCVDSAAAGNPPHPTCSAPENDGLYDCAAASASGRALPPHCDASLASSSGPTAGDAAAVAAAASARSAAAASGSATAATAAAVPSKAAEHPAVAMQRYIQSTAAGSSNAAAGEAQSYGAFRSRMGQRLLQASRKASLSRGAQGLRRL